MRRSRWVPMAIAATATAAVVGGLALTSGSGATTATNQVSAELAAANSKSTKTVTVDPFRRLTAAQIRLKSLIALKTATSVYVQGAVTTVTRVTGTAATTKDAYTLNLHVGANAFGTVSNGTGTLSVRRVGTDLYLGPDDAYLAKNGRPELVAALHGKWVKVAPTSSSYTTIAPLTYPTTWKKMLASVPATTRKTSGTFGGIPTVALYSGRGPEVTTLYIATKGAPLPVYAVTTNKANHLSFTHWNQAVTTSAPDPNDVVTAPASLNLP